MADNKDSEKKVSYKERLIMSDKAGYKVPAFLLSKFDNDPADKEFTTIRGDSESEIPLWWKRDIALPVSKSEFRKDKKRAITSKKAMDLQVRRLDESLASYIKAINEQEQIFQKRCEQLRSLEEGKNTEIEEQFKLNDRNYQLRLMEFEALLQKEYQENAILKQKSESLTLRDKLKEKMTEAEDKAVEKLEAVENEYKKISEENRIIREELVKLYKESELPKDEEPELLSADEIINVELPEEISAEAKEELPPEEELLPDKDYFPYKKVLSACDENNIIEARALSVEDRTTKTKYLNNVHFSVPRKGVTVVYSNSQDTLSLIYSVIMRNLPSDLHITQGEVRIDGELISQLLKGEFSVKMHSIATNFTEIEDKLARSQKNYKITFKGYNIDYRLLNERMQEFGLDVKVLSEKQNRLDEGIREKLSIATILSAKTPLILMYSPSVNYAEEDRNRLISALNSVKNSALVLFTSDSSFAVEIKNNSLYTF